MDVRNEIGTEVDLRSTRVADRLGRLEANIATVPGNAHCPNSRTSSQKATWTKAFHRPQYLDDEATSSDGHCEDSKVEYESDILDSKDEENCRRHRKKTKEKGRQIRSKLIGGLESVTQRT